MIQKHRHSRGKQAKSQMKCRTQVFSVSVRRQTRRRGRGWGEPCRATFSAWRQFQACSTPMGNMYMRAPTLLCCKEFRESHAGQNRTELKGQTWHQEKTLEVCTRTEWLSVVRRENPTWRSKSNIREKAIMNCKLQQVLQNQELVRSPLDKLKKVLCMIHRTENAYPKGSNLKIRV